MKKISYELEQGYIDVWNEESEEWDRYIKVNKESVVEEKKIPEKMDRELNCDDDTVRGLVASVNEIYKEIADKYNEIIDYLKSKGDE